MSKINLPKEKDGIPETAMETTPQPIPDTKTASQSISDTKTASQPISDTKTASQPISDTKTASQPISDTKTASQPILEDSSGHEVQPDENAKGDQGKTTKDHIASWDESDDELIEPAVLLEYIKLHPDEQELFYAVASGDVIVAKEILDKMSAETVQKLSTRYNVERDTVFHVAVRRQDEAMLEFLFFHVPNVERLLYDILLLAISESNISLVQNILQEIDSNVKLKISKGGLSELPRWENSQFPDYMTPMMLSGIIGNYELITIFGTRYEVIESTQRYYRGSGKPKKPKTCFGECFCCCMTDPHDSTVFDHLEADYKRLNEYQAKASPDMLCYYANTTKNFDPILKALEYMNELEVIKLVEIEFREQYESIITNLKDFVVHLISKCENPLELELLLSRSEGYHGAHDKYPRVIMAIEMGFREFVAHPHTQGTLYMEWAGGDWFEWRFLTVAEKLKQFCYRTVFLPLYLLFVCGEQGNNYGRLLASPLSRCIYSCISQMFFVALSMIEQSLELRQPRYRRPPNPYLELILVLFVAGQIRLLIKQFFTAPKIFWKQAWNWYDTINYCLYCCCFLCWGILYLRDAQEESEYFERFQPAERLYWSYMDLFMVADSFLALGTVMASGKLLRYVQLNSTIGPIQVALGKMIKNISLFIPMFAIVFSSFALAITAIYAPYVSLTREDQSKHSLSTHMNTLYQMYWGLYGMTDTASADMSTWLTKNGTQPDPYHYLTAELAGKLLFSVYTLLGATILFSSMLVAYMVNTFGAIIEENEINWKFSRAELWIYFSRSSVMPPPLNLIPTLWDIIHLARTIREVGKDPARYFVKCNCAICLYSATKFTEAERLKQEELYHDFVKALIRRYFRHQADVESRAQASAEEALTLSEDMEELQSLINTVLFKLDKGDRNDPGEGGDKSPNGDDDDGPNNGDGMRSLIKDDSGKAKKENSLPLFRHNSSSPLKAIPKNRFQRPSDITVSNKGERRQEGTKWPPLVSTNSEKHKENSPSIVQAAVLKYSQKISPGDQRWGETKPTRVLNNKTFDSSYKLKTTGVANDTTVSTSSTTPYVYKSDISIGGRTVPVSDIKEMATRAVNKGQSGVLPSAQAAWRSLESAEQPRTVLGKFLHVIHKPSASVKTKEPDDTPLAKLAHPVNKVKPPANTDVTDVRKNIEKPKPIVPRQQSTVLYQVPSTGENATRNRNVESSGTKATVSAPARIGATGLEVPPLPQKKPPLPPLPTTPSPSTDNLMKPTVRKKK